MTDLSETRTVRSLVAPERRSSLCVAMTAAQGLGSAMIALVQRSASDNPHVRAERVRLAQGLREDARRKVDRLMM